MSVDFASAALRHQCDAEHLLQIGAGQSVDQAWHLGGFTHECVRKACVKEAWIPKLLGHDFSTVGETVLEIAIALDPRASRFQVLGWSTRYPTVTAWRPEHRYERTGTTKHKQRPVEALVEEGREAVNACLVDLLLEGELDLDGLR